MVKSMNCISVAIDGPAGAGKSSVAKSVAAEMGYVYIDTGAMYRTVGLYALQNNIDPKNEDKLSECVDSLDIQIKYANGEQRIYLNGKDVSDDIRTSEVSRAASDVATIGVVRKKLVAMQQDMATKDNVIMDGRDICTTVLPNAQIKIFLTASVEARAHRRYAELIEKGAECEYQQIKEEIIARDKNDSGRKISPLRQAEDAVLLDTSDMTFEEVKNTLKKMIMEYKDVL